MQTPQHLVASSGKRRSLVAASTKGRIRANLIRERPRKEVNNVHREREKEIRRRRKRREKSRKRRIKELKTQAKKT